MFSGTVSGLEIKLEMKKKNVEKKTKTDDKESC